MAWADIIQARPAWPAALGADLAPYPYLSGYGLMLRITRLARPLPSQVGDLGFRNRNVADVLLATQRASKPTDGLLRVLGLHGSHVAKYWLPQTWSPVQIQDLFLRQARPVRQCPHCAQHGYHCTVFQLPSITHCPWHGARLYDQCPQCGTALHARFNEKAQLGMCACGYDRFDPVMATVDMWAFPGDRARTWLEAYLAWAVRQRHSRWLCVPAAFMEWDSGFAALAAPPRALQARSGVDGATLQEAFCGPGADPAPRQFWGWGLWGGERPLSVAPLPSTLYPRLCEATTRVVEHLPCTSRTPFELAQSHALRADVSLRENIVQRPDCFIAPHGRGTSSSAWLNLSVVDAGIAAFCGEVLDQVTRQLGTPPTVEPRSLQAQRSHAMDAIQGRRHLSFALESVLTHAYSQGLSKILSAKLGAPSLAASQRPYPILEFNGRPGKLRSVRTYWCQAGTPPTRVYASPPNRGRGEASLAVSGDFGRAAPQAHSARLGM